MSDVDLRALRVPFTDEYIGKLPRITCKDCSDKDKQCGRHRQEKCAECGNYISTEHKHVDYVGHANVTDRLLEVDPEWTWQPQATDPDPELLKAAIATGNPEIVQKVIGNAPPRFGRDRYGNPVSLWIYLTIGGATKPGVGSVPSNQFDAEKVLIGDALRNAALRFGVALDQWVKGDRADPTAENAIAAGGKAERNPGAAFDGAAPAGRQQDKVWRPRQDRQEPEQAKPDLGDWGIRVDGIASQDDADAVEAELRGLYEAGKIDARRANLIKTAIRGQAGKVAARKAGAA